LKEIKIKSYIIANKDYKTPLMAKLCIFSKIQYMCVFIILIIRLRVSITWILFDYSYDWV